MVFARVFVPLAMALAAICCRAAVDQDASEQALAQFALSAAFANLQLIKPVSMERQNLIFATWQNKDGKTSSISIASIGKQDEQVAVFWSSTKRNAYEPTIRYVPTWQYKSNPILALNYSQGAAAQQVEIYGVENDGKLTLLDSRLGEVIEWQITTRGELLLDVYSRPSGVLKPACLGWNEKASKLVKCICGK